MYFKLDKNIIKLELNDKHKFFEILEKLYLFKTPIKLELVSTEYTDIDLENRWIRCCLIFTNEEHALKFQFILLGIVYGHFIKHDY